MPCRTKKSSTCLHLLMHIFMIHGVDPLVEEAVNRSFKSFSEHTSKRITTTYQVILFLVSAK
jgi:hypothetical protein